MVDWPKRPLLVITVSGIGWIDAIARWRSTNQTPGPVEMAAYPFGLPFFLVLSIGGGSLLLRRLRQVVDTPPAPPKALEIGMVCATGAAVPAVLDLSLAPHKAIAERRTALCRSNQDALKCLAVVMPAATDPDIRP